MASQVDVVNQEEFGVARGTAPIKIVGDLRKKSKWRGAWLLRRFELHEDNTVLYFHPLSGKLLGKIYLSVGIVRCVHNGTDTELQIRDARKKTFYLRAPTVEARNTWCHYINRTLSGSTGDPVATAAGGKVKFGASATVTDVEVDMDVDVVVPASFDREATGGTLVLRLMDGRTLNMTVPEGTARGHLLRARVNTLTRDAATEMDLDAPVVACADSLQPSNVPILVPFCKRAVEAWAPTMGFTPVRGGAQQSAAAPGTADQDVTSGGGGWADEMPPAVADLVVGAHEVDGDLQHKAKASVFSTGKYDMTMLLKLGKLESEFKEGLANLWECEDEDELPEQLQEVDFNDILGVGESAVERSTWLLLLLTGAEDYREDMSEKLEALVHKTVAAIQALEEAC